MTRKPKFKSEMASFKAAINGLKVAMLSERHLRFHLCAFALVAFVGFWLGCTMPEMAILVLVSVIVLVAEMVNTAIEKVCDLIQSEQDIRVRHIKDIAAGAVLLAAGGALIVGCLILLPRIFCLEGPI